MDFAVLQCMPARGRIRARLRGGISALAPRRGSGGGNRGGEFECTVNFYNGRTSNSYPIMGCRRPTGGDEQAGCDLENIPPRGIDPACFVLLDSAESLGRQGVQDVQVTEVAAQLLHRPVFNLGGKAATLHLN